MTTPIKPRDLKVNSLTLNRETLATLGEAEAEMVVGGKKKTKPKTVPPMTLGPTCDPPQSAHCGSGRCSGISCGTC